MMFTSKAVPEKAIDVGDAFTEGLADYTKPAVGVDSVTNR